MTEIKIYDQVEQGTPEWHSIRRGKMTASQASKIGTKGAGLNTLVQKLAGERFSEYDPEAESITNVHIERGNRLEPIARALYELETGNDVVEVAFIERNDYIGISPDGLVGDDGMVEIKCPDMPEFIRFLTTLKPKSEYMWQMQMQMCIAKRQWVDHVVYNEEFDKKNMVVVRVPLDIGMQMKLEEGLAVGESKIIALENQIKERLKDERTIY